MNLPSNVRILFDTSISKENLVTLQNRFTFYLETNEISKLYGVYTNPDGYIYRGSHSKESFDYRDNLPVVPLSHYLPK